MALELTTVGAYVAYCIETTGGARPTAGYTKIPDVSTAPEIALTTETLDASNLEDKITRYVDGRQDPGGEKAFTVNNTDNFRIVWSDLVEAAETARADGKETWFMYVLPGSSEAFYWSGIPKTLGTGEMAQNSVHTLQASVICTGVAGWATVSQLAA